MKAGIYARVSTEEQNVDSQVAHCTEYCKRMNIDIFKVYTDVYTGTSDNRPAFNELIDDMRQYRFNVIVVSRLDRLTRSLKHLLTFIDELKTKAVGIVSVTQNIDTTSPAGVFQMQVFGAVAEFERNLISSRTKEAFYKDSEGRLRSRKTHKLVGVRGKDKQERKKRGVLRKGQKQAQIN